jgi:hypothetical protein
MAYTKTSKHHVYSSIKEDVLNFGQWRFGQDVKYSDENTRYLTGSYLPNHKQREAQSLSATTSLDAGEVKHYRTGSVGAHWVWNSWEQYSTVSKGLYHVSVLKPDLQSIAENKVRAKALSSLGSKFQSLTFLGELREAAHMIRHPAYSLRQKIDDYASKMARWRTKLRRKPEKFRKVAAESWLEQAFGWKPLVSDIENGLAAYNEWRDKTATESFSFQYVADAKEATSKTTSGYNFSHFEWSTDVLHAYSSRYYGKVLLDVTHSNDFRSSFGLWPEEIIPTGWELLPYSFLIDYFINIGEILNTSVAYNRLAYAYVGHTQRRIIVNFVSGNPIQPQAGPGIATLVEGHPAFGTTIQRNVVRAPVADIPLPSLSGTLSLNLGRGLNIAALIASRGSDRQFTRKHQRRYRAHNRRTGHDLESVQPPNWWGTS